MQLINTMKTKHTPGPWWIDDSGFIAAGSSDTYKTIADPRCMEPTPDNMPEMEANARLIAAAPEMAHFIVEMADRYPNSEWISGEAKRILTKAGIQP